MRSRQSISELNRPVDIQASRIDGPVSLPSRRLVTSRTGMRISEGKMPK